MSNPVQEFSYQLSKQFTLSVKADGDTDFPGISICLNGELKGAVELIKESGEVRIITYPTEDENVAPIIVPLAYYSFAKKADGTQATHTTLSAMAGVLLEELNDKELSDSYDKGWTAEETISFIERHGYEVTPAMEPGHDSSSTPLTAQQIAKKVRENGLEYTVLHSLAYNENIVDQELRSLIHVAQTTLTRIHEKLNRYQR